MMTRDTVRPAQEHEALLTTFIDCAENPLDLRLAVDPLDTIIRGRLARISQSMRCIEA